VGDHIALIYDSPEERVSAVTPLIRVGLEKGELCLYISNEENDTGLVDALRAENIDVEKAIGNGGLILTHKQEMYFKQGFFDPEWTLKVIGNIADLAKSYGFTAMRIISDMRWDHDKVAGAQKWPEYEAKLNVLNPGISLRIICQYDRAAFSPSSLIIALHAHPKVVSGGLVNKNQFYVPTDQLLQGDYSELELQRMLDSIHLHNSTEADLLSRDQVLEEMRHKVGEALAAKKAVEDELNEQIARFNDLAERSSDWCWELDENGVYTWSSARVKDILGMVPEDIVGRTPLDLVSRDETDRIAKLLTKTMAAHVPITALEKEVRHKDGHTVFLEMSGMPQFGPDGRFLGYRGIDRDITGRKAAKQAIEDSRKRIEDSLAQIHERDLRIEALEVAMAQLKAVQSERDAAVQSVKESLRSSQAELNRTKEELGRVRDALGLREDELALARTAAEAKQEELDEYKASLTLLRQNLEDKEAELLSSQRELTEVQTLLKEKERELEELSRASVPNPAAWRSRGSCRGGGG
jgi:PAS domain S-box-containing protein